MNLCKAIDRVVDSKLFGWLLEATVIRGWSMFAVALVLAKIAIVCGGGCWLASWIFGPRVLVVAVPTALVAARQIWKAYR